MKKAIIAIMATAIIFLTSCLTTSGSSDPVEIKLKAVDSTLETTGNLLIEDGGNIGYWENLEDVVMWDLEIPSNGEYNVFLKMSCDPEFAGSTVAVTIGDQVLEVLILDSGAWSDYKTLEVGSINLKKGSYTIKVQATNILNRFVGNLSYVKLVK